jgi:hypothetical protein
MKTTTATCVFVLLIAGLCIEASAQEFQKSYSLSPGGRVSVRNSSGSIRISPYNGAEIKVSAFREGRDADNLSVQDNSSASAIDLRVHYPIRFCLANCNARIRFEILVPERVVFNYDEISTASGSIQIERTAGDLRAHSASGRIELTDTTGNIWAHAASGSITINGATGSVTASTASGAIKALAVNGALECRAASGRVEAGLLRLEPSASVNIRTASGGVSLSLPDKIDAAVELSTHGGHVQCDLPLQIRKLGHGREVQGILGSGSGSSRIRISSASGSINLKRNG